MRELQIALVDREVMQMSEIKRSSLHQQADEIEAAIKAGTVRELPMFAQVDPSSVLNVARATVAAYRENERRMGR